MLLSDLMEIQRHPVKCGDGCLGETAPPQGQAGQVRMPGQVTCEVVAEVKLRQRQRLQGREACQEVGNSGYETLVIVIAVHKRETKPRIHDMSQLD